MQIKFNDGTAKKCYNPIETTLFQNGKRAGWLFSFDMNVINAEEAESILTQDNISSVSIQDDKDTSGYALGGYDKVNGITIRYGDTGGIASVDLKRGIRDGECNKRI